MGQPKYRTDQIARWIWQERVGDFSAMSNLPAELRQTLADRFVLRSGKVVERTKAADGTVKLLIEWPDGERIETVMIPSGTRATACVSTQVGCGMKCAFCASGMHGLKRNLTVAEIVEQVMHLSGETPNRISHVVFMGMGEPLANYEATVGAIRAMIDPQRLGISARHITVSTVGLPKGIRKLAEEDIPVTLAISLHAATDAMRREIIPAALRYPLEEIMLAAQEFFDSRHRQVTLEYVVLPGVNDTNVCAESLARVAMRLAANVNLISFNPVPSLPFSRPTSAEMRAFADRLEKRGANVQIRRSRGLEADAACGQLRQRKATTEETALTTENTESTERKDEAEGKP